MNYIDKNGRPFEVRGYQTEDHSRLVEMYEHFSPKAKFQGMPPLDKENCRKWILKLLESGENFLAWREDEVIGHVVVIPDHSVEDGEYLIFVNQSNRNVGVGTELTWQVIEKAKNLGLHTIWLTVGTYNFRATKLYTKFGFGFSEEKGDESERKMILRL